MQTMHFYEQLWRHINAKKCLDGFLSSVLFFFYFSHLQIRPGRWKTPSLCIVAFYCSEPFNRLIFGFLFSLVLSYNVFRMHWFYECSSAYAFVYFVIASALCLLTRCIWFIYTCSSSSWTKIHILFFLFAFGRVLTVLKMVILEDYRASMRFNQLQTSSFDLKIGCTPHIAFLSLKNS